MYTILWSRLSLDQIFKIYRTIRTLLQTREASAACSLAAGRASKKVKFPKQASIHKKKKKKKKKTAITQEIITFKLYSALHFSSNSQTTGTCCN